MTENTVWVQKWRPMLSSIDGGKTFEPNSGAHGDTTTFWFNPLQILKKYDPCRWRWRTVSLLWGVKLVSTVQMPLLNSTESYRQINSLYRNLWGQGRQFFCCDKAAWPFGIRWDSSRALGITQQRRSAFLAFDSRWSSLCNGRSYLGTIDFAWYESQVGYDHVMIAPSQYLGRDAQICASLQLDAPIILVANHEPGTFNMLTTILFQRSRDNVRAGSNLLPTSRNWKGKEGKVASYIPIKQLVQKIRNASLTSSISSWKRSILLPKWLTD